MVKTFSENSNGKVLTPASNELFQRGDSGFLSDKNEDIFHNCVGKGTFISKRSRPDIVQTLLVFPGRVGNPNKDDWIKLRRLREYLQVTLEEQLVFFTNTGVNISKWHIDVSFVINDDARSCTGKILTT